MYFFSRHLFLFISVQKTCETCLTGVIQHSLHRHCYIASECRGSGDFAEMNGIRGQSGTVNFVMYSGFNWLVGTSAATEIKA